jgi:hypothetical protein
MLPTYGSTITPRSRLALERGAHRARSLYGTTIVSRAVPAVMPGESGTPIVSALAAGRDQERVAVAVVAARELDDLRRAR